MFREASRSSGTETWAEGAGPLVHGGSRGARPEDVRKYIMKVKEVVGLVFFTSRGTTLKSAALYLRNIGICTPNI